MTDQPYTQADLTLAAMFQLRRLAGHHTPTNVGRWMEDDYIRMVEDPDGGMFQPAPGSPRWGELSEEEFAAAQRAIHDLITGAADLSPWAVAAGADGLEPAPDALVHEHAGRTLARVHVAFAADLPDEDRERVMRVLGDALLA